MNSRLVAVRDINIPRIRAAENIRRELKAAFPGVNFSVKTKSFSGGDDINISWTDGPTTEEVQAITSKYEEGSFDGMVDMYNYHKDRDDLIGGAKYVFENRHISDEAWTREFKKMGYDYKKGSGFYGFELIDADGAVVDPETVRHLMREVSNKSFYDGPRGGKADLIREPYEDKWKNPKPATEEPVPDEKTDKGTTVDMNEAMRKSVPSGMMQIIDPREATARRHNMDTRAADKKKYDPNTSYERENLERIAKEWAKFCKDKGVLNPGRHDFRIWMEQNYPRITPLDALKQMAMDAVWGKADPYRSPSNGEMEHQADHYQKRMSGDKDKKEKTEAARTRKVGDVVYMTADALENYGEQYKGKPLTITRVSTKYMPAKDFYARGKPDGYHPGYDTTMKGIGLYDFAELENSLYEYEVQSQKTTAAKIDRLWIVIYPGPKSTLADILFSANVADLQKQFAGGLDPNDVFGMYDNEKEARENAESLLSALPGKIEAAMRAKADEDEPEKPWTPHFKLVALDETEYWSDSVFKDFPEIKAIYGIYIFDETLGVHMAELTPSHELWFVNHYITYTDEFMGKFRDSNEDVSDEAKERMIQIEDFICDNADYSERVTYKHASDISGMGSEYIQDIGEGVSTEDDDYESQMEDAIEHENGNPSSWDALDKLPAKDPRVRTDKDMQRENRAATEKEKQTTIHNFARRVRATRIKGNRKVKAEKEPWQMTLTEYAIYRKYGIPPIGHKRIVEKAIREGKPVPPEVLADYPDLKATGKKVNADAKMSDKEKIETLRVALKDAEFLLRKVGINWREAGSMSDSMKRSAEDAREALKATAMRTTADADDEGGDLRTELTDEDGAAIIDKIQNTPDMPDSEFHEFVEGLGIKPSAAETFAYGVLYDLLNEGTQTAEEPEPPIEMGVAARRKAKAGDDIISPDDGDPTEGGNWMIFIPENKIIPENGYFKRNPFVKLRRL